MTNTGLSEDDFKVEGHACAISIPAVRTATQPIDFDQQMLKDYLAAHYPQNTTEPCVKNKISSQPST